MSFLFIITEDIHKDIPAIIIATIMDLTRSAFVLLKFVEAIFPIFTKLENVKSSDKFLNIDIS